MSGGTRITVPESSTYGSELETINLTRRQLLTLAASASAGLVFAACAPAAPSSPATATALPPPETTKIRLACSPCDAPFIAAEAYLHDEGFTDVQISDSPPLTALADGKVDVVSLVALQIASALQDGKQVVSLGGLHPGCTEIWAPQSVASLKELRGRTMVVQSKTLPNLMYSETVIFLKQAGIDPQDVDFVVQSDANPVELYLNGKSDAVRVAAAVDEALKVNPANKGHVVFSQVTDEPWAHMDCCVVVATQDWYRTNPIATKRAMRAILRAADALTAEKAAAAKAATDKGLFGGTNNFANVRNAMNMLTFKWRDLDAEKSLRFQWALLANTGLLKLSVDELAKSFDLRILNELKAELKKTS